MPFLRFTRDRRGYENTYVMHTYRRRGKTRSRVLYWFRTPPDVKVGRAALDEDAIRMIEESNPDLTFDWDQILATRAVPQPDERGPRGAGRLDRPGRRPTASARAPVAVAPPVEEPLLPAEGFAEPAESSSEDTFESHDLLEAKTADGAGDEIADGLEVEPAPPVRPVEQLLDPETLNRVRGRYAELLARISQQVNDPAQRELLRTEAGRLNPDVWVTAEEVREGLEHFEQAFEAIRSRLPQRRRRRRRRGRPDSDERQAGEPAGGPPSEPEAAEQAAEKRSQNEER